MTNRLRPLTRDQHALKANEILCSITKATNLDMPRLLMAVVHSLLACVNDETDGAIRRLL